MLRIIVSLLAISILLHHPGFPSASERIVFTQRVPLPVRGKENPPQVWMPLEGDPEHIERFPLHPVGGLPNRDHRRDPGSLTREGDF